MRKTIVCLLALVLILTASGLTVSAAQPDRTFTYEDGTNPVPSTNAYKVMNVITSETMGLEVPMKDARDIFMDSDDIMYIVDSGNARILVLDTNYKCTKILSEFTYGEETLTLAKGAQGIFVREPINSDKKMLYIADTDNNRILVSDLDGVVTKIYGLPKDDLLDAKKLFKPKKVIVDNMGIMYVTSGSFNDGAMLIDSAGSFLGFYGTNKLKETAAMKTERMWRNLMKRAAKQESFETVEFNNIFWSDDRFVYTVSNVAEKLTTSVSKLNALGNDVFPQTIDLYSLQKTRKLGAMVPKDITVDSEGAISFIDGTSKLIFQYDESCNLLAVFGGSGYQQGLFMQPVSMECDSANRLYVLDTDPQKNNITIMEQTFYGQMIRSANLLYNQGLYYESIEPWMEVLRMNANYTQAYVGLGKAYVSLGEYETAMEYFKLGKDTAGYGEAKSLLRDEIVRKNFALVAAIVVIAMFSILGWESITAIVSKVYWRIRK